MILLKRNRVRIERRSRDKLKLPNLANNVRTACQGRSPVKYIEIIMLIATTKLPCRMLNLPL